MSGNDKRMIGSLRDLPQEIAPPRDLWKGIEAQIAAERKPTAGTAAPRSSRAVPLRVLAAAAVIVALAVGVWIGRVLMPTPGGALPNGTGAPNGLTANNRPSDEPGAFHAAYVMGPKYINQRAQLVKDLESRLARLPPPSRAKVLSSLKAINDSKRDLERELGKDPSNALLQELLVNTYQDEMRVLTAVHEAGRPGEGI